MGGRAFKGVNIGISNEANTPPIKKEFIKPTMDGYFAVLGEIFPQAKSIFNENNFSPVGSVGKKAYSGDIDLAIDTKDTILFGEYSPANVAKWGVKSDEPTSEEVKGWEETLMGPLKGIPAELKAKIIPVDAKGEVTFKDIERWATIFMFAKRGVKKKFQAGQVSDKERLELLTETRVKALLTFIAFKIQNHSFSNSDHPRIIVKADKVTAGNIFTGFTVLDEDNNPAIVNEDTGAPDDDGDVAYAQVDWMLGKASLLKFSYFSDTYDDREDQVKGLHRTQLMLAMFSAVGYTFSHVKGLIKKPAGSFGTEKEVKTQVAIGEDVYSDDKDQIIQVLQDYYGKEVTETSLQNYSTLWAIVDKSEYRDDVAETYLNILQSTRADVPTELEADWLAYSDYAQKYGPVKWKGQTIQPKEKPDGKYYNGKFLDNDKYAMKQFATMNDKGEAVAQTVKESRFSIAAGFLGL